MNNDSRWGYTLLATAMIIIIVSCCSCQTLERASGIELSEVETENIEGVQTIVENVVPTPWNIPISFASGLVAGWMLRIWKARKQLEKEAKG